MDDLAQIEGKTPEQRAARARNAWRVYRRQYRGSEIQDLMADLAHLADLESTDGGDYALRSAETHYSAERP